MPTWERTARFYRDWQALGPEDRERFRKAARHFVEDLRRDRFRAGLRMKRVRGTDDLFEMTFAPDGRATFQYGPVKGTGAHVIWRRVGRHDILRRP